MENPDPDFDQKNANTKLAGMARIFSLLGTDCTQNIHIIVKETCHLLDGACSLYNRIDDKKNSLTVCSGHNLEQNFDLTLNQSGTVCGEATLKSGNKPVIISDLETSPYYEQDANIQKYHIKSYIGFPIKRNDAVIGSLCVADTRKRQFSKDDIHILQTLAAALSLEEERLYEKEKYRVLFENANDAIYIIQDNILKFANPRLSELCGYTSDELAKLPFVKLIHPDDQQLIVGNYMRRVKGEKFPSTYSFRLINKKNKIIWVQINSVRVDWDNRPAVLSCLRDITRLKELENKLSQAEKMELVGTMAGGVAHDLNNILSGLVSYPEIVLLQLPADSPLKKPIKSMHEAGLKAADIVQDLLTMARRGLARENVVNLNNVVHEYFNSPSHTRLENHYPRIRFVTNCETELMNISGSASHISKMLMNLVINAAEAIKKDGLVTVATRNRQIHSPLKGYDTVRKGNYAALSVTDSGDGIAREDLNRIFEPFYTKKQLGRSGSGLGLSVVWNCIKDHDGYIEVKSNKKKGTVFELFFPGIKDTVQKTSENFVVNEHVGHGEIILIADDIMEQRQLAQDCINALGYNAFCVASGEQAVAFIHNNPVDLVLLDMEMGSGMNGLETYQQIRKVRPAQKAVIALALTDDRPEDTNCLHTSGLYIKKPYTLKKLAFAIKTGLAKSS